MLSHSPFVYFSLFLIDYQHVSKRKKQILTPSKGALISKHLEAPEDHQGSHCPFIAQCFSLPLAPPPPPLALPFLLGVISESSLRQPDNPDTHTHADRSLRLILIPLPTAAFTSTRSRTPQGHVEIFQTEMRSVLLFLWLPCRIPKSIFFCLWEQGRRDSNEKITETFSSFFLFFLVAKLDLLCGKLMSSLCSSKQIRYLARTATLYLK